MGKYSLQVHPDCQLLSVSSDLKTLYLIGYLLDPHQPGRSSFELLSDMAELSIQQIIERLYKLTGRFVLLIWNGKDCTFFHDPCGLKTFYYMKQDEDFYAASQPLLIDKVYRLVKTPAYTQYFNSKYVKNHIEHWLPSGLSLYENVCHLLPNHFVTLSEGKQKRYWPVKKLHKGDYQDLLPQFSSLLKKIMVTANADMDLALSLTAGWDSRMLLSAGHDIVDELTFYTLKYRGMDADHKDIRIPSSLAKKLDLNYEIFDCEKDVTQEFAEIYKQNSHMAHLDDWGKIAFGMWKTFPQNKIAVKGNCSEIGRCFYYPNGKHPTNPSAKDLNTLEKDWAELDFISHHLHSWYQDIQTVTDRLGYAIYDLFYWEHKMGSWQAQSQLEWDIAQEVFTPFNSRELLDLMFAVDTSYRKKAKPFLYRDAMKILWEKVLQEPINPHTKRVKKLLKKLRILS